MKLKIENEVEVEVEVVFGFRVSPRRHDSLDQDATSSFEIRIALQSPDPKIQIII